MRQQKRPVVVYLEGFVYSITGPNWKRHADASIVNQQVHFGLSFDDVLSKFPYCFEVSQVNVLADYVGVVGLFNNFQLRLLGVGHISYDHPTTS